MTPNGLFRLDYYGPGESFTGTWYEDNMIDYGEDAPLLYERDKRFMTSQGELPDWQKEQLNFGADYWNAVLKHTKAAKQPVTLAVTLNNEFRKRGGRGQ